LKVIGEFAMATLHPRLSITFDPEKAALLSVLAEQNHQSISAMAKELIIEALERREDMGLSALAAKRDTKHQKRIKHHDAWK
jgi:predicted transcriptional regulator